MEILIYTLLVLVYFIIETIYRDYFKFKRENQGTVNQIELHLENKRSEIELLGDELGHHFQCHLCHSTKTDTNVISISGKEYSQISKKRPHKFLKVTCMGCGRSQFFNLNQLWGSDGIDPLPIDRPIYQRFLTMADHYDCAYCPNQKAVAKIITVRKKGLRHMLSPQPSELISLCCRKCGWTTFFDHETVLNTEAKRAKPGEKEGEKNLARA